MIREAAGWGWAVIICTARPVRAMRLAVPAWFGDHYWAACNGAWVLRKEEILRRVEMSHERALYWIEALKQHEMHYFIEAGDSLYSDGEMRGDFVGACNGLDALGDGGVCKVLVNVRSEDEVARVRDLMPADCGFVVTDSGGLAQIAHRDCDKLSAVEFVLEREGLGLDDVIAFGDDHNDMSLVAGSGCGVAMGNATDELKAVADHMALTNDEDGVGVFLEGVLFP